MNLPVRVKHARRSSVLNVCGIFFVIIKETNNSAMALSKDQKKLAGGVVLALIACALVGTILYFVFAETKLKEGAYRATGNISDCATHFGFDGPGNVTCDTPVRDRGEDQTWFSVCCGGTRITYNDDGDLCIGITETDADGKISTDDSKIGYVCLGKLKDGSYGGTMKYQESHIDLKLKISSSEKFSLVASLDSDRGVSSEVTTDFEYDSS